MPEICTICHQQIRPGEPSDTFQSETYHEDPDYCVAAVARRCAEIAHEISRKHWSDYKGGEHRGDPHYQGLSDGAAEVEAALRAEFPEVKP
jgi:hypothetical protein